MAYPNKRRCSVNTEKQYCSFRELLLTGKQSEELTDGNVPFAVFRGTELERLVPVVNLSLASRMPYVQQSAKNGRSVMIQNQKNTWVLIKFAQQLNPMLRQ